MRMGADTDTIERQHQLGTTAATLKLHGAATAVAHAVDAPPHSGGAHGIRAGAAAAGAASSLEALRIARYHCTMLQ